MPTFRQGYGTIKTISATGPAEWSDGTPLNKNEVSHFEFDLEYQGGLQVNSLKVFLSDSPEDEIWQGTFSEPIYIDDQEPGIYYLRYRTVHTSGTTSLNSMPYRLEILPSYKHIIKEKFKKFKRDWKRWSLK